MGKREAVAEDLRRLGLILFSAAIISGFLGSRFGWGATLMGAVLGTTAWAIGVQLTGGDEE